MDTPDQPVELKFSHLPENTLSAFKVLSQQKWLKGQGWYLAGGTALALQLDHRVSVDLDFFTTQSAFDEEFIILELSALGWITSLREKGTLYGELKGAKISFITYPYFVPKQPFISHQFISIADAGDIAVMKVIAISQRGKKRDFFDLYWYTTHAKSLINVLKCVDTRFPNLQHNYHHILKSLTYFAEAEDDPEPQVLVKVSWDQVKKHFLAEVPKIANEFL